MKSMKMVFAHVLLLVFFNAHISGMEKSFLDTMREEAAAFFEKLDESLFDTSKRRDPANQSLLSHSSKNLDHAKGAYSSRSNSWPVVQLEPVYKSSQEIELTLRNSERNTSVPSKSDHRCLRIDQLCQKANDFTVNYNNQHSQDIIALHELIHQISKAKTEYAITENELGYRALELADANSSWIKKNSSYLKVAIMFKQIEVYFNELAKQQKVFQPLSGIQNYRSHDQMRYYGINIDHLEYDESDAKEFISLYRCVKKRVASAYVVVDAGHEIEVGCLIPYLYPNVSKKYGDINYECEEDEEILYSSKEDGLWQIDHLATHLLISMNAASKGEHYKYNFMLCLLNILNILDAAKKKYNLNEEECGYYSQSGLLPHKKIGILFARIKSYNKTISNSSLRTPTYQEYVDYKTSCVHRRIELIIQKLLYGRDDTKLQLFSFMGHQTYALEELEDLYEDACKILKAREEELQELLSYLYPTK